MEQFIKLGLNLLPINEKPIAITLHNIKSSEEKWFVQMLDFFEENFQFINPSELSNIEDINKRAILLTFDDGFESNRKIAEKFLNPRNIKAIFFITTNFINSGKTDSKSFIQNSFFPKKVIDKIIYKEINPMTWEDVIWLSKNGHEIGAHTKNHQLLSNLNKCQIYDEVYNSAKIIEEKIEKNVINFAYPFGNLNSINKDTYNLVKRRFKYAFSNIRGNLIDSPNNHFLYRQNIEPLSPIWKIKAIVDGKIDLKYQKQRKHAKSLLNKNFS